MPSAVPRAHDASGLMAGMESSGLVQHRKTTIHGFPVKSGKSDWLRIRNEYSVHTQKIRSDESSRSLSQARRIMSSWNENGQMRLDGSRIGKKNVADSKISGDVWAWS